MEKYVVISEKPLNGSRVMSMAQTREKAEQSLRNVQQCERLQQYGPFSIVSAAEAEEEQLYGD